MAPSPDQQFVIDLVVNNRNNVALYAPAGYGKSYVRDRIAAHTPAVIVGPTGLSIAACRGMTIDRFIGCLSSIDVYPHTVVIVEEVSLVPVELFVTLSDALCKKCGTVSVFGGLQVVLIGDMYQLIPPKSTNFFFETDIYKKLNPVVYQLVTSHRAYDEDSERDCVFKNFLRCCRHGCFTNGTEGYLTWFNQRSIPVGVPTICATRKRADMYNRMVLSRQADTIHLDGFAFFIGAEAIVNKNVYKGNEFLVANSWRGTIVTYSSECHTIGVNIASEIIDIPLVNGAYPIELAYGMTIHKSEGETMRRVCVDATHMMFEPGQAYVAVSRVKRMCDLYTRFITPEDFMIPRPVAVQQYITKHNLV